MYSKGWGTYRNKQKALANAKIAYDSGDLRALEIIEGSEEKIKNNYNTSVAPINKRVSSKPVSKQKSKVIVPNTGNEESTEPKPIESLDEEAKQYQLISQCTVAESHYAMGRMYYYGTTAPIDYLKALYHFYHAAKNDHAEACFMLGAMYFDGDAVEVNYSEAFKLFSKASELGDIDADYYLAAMYGKGLGIDRDNQKSFKHAKSAAQKGDADSIALLAMNYITGAGTERDLVLARALFEKAAKQGHQKSINILNESSCWET
jgi:TPR repeat protein